MPPRALILRPSDRTVHAAESLVIGGILAVLTIGGLLIEAYRTIRQEWRR